MSAGTIAQTIAQWLPVILSAGSYLFGKRKEDKELEKYMKRMQKYYYQTLQTATGQQLRKLRDIYTAKGMFYTTPALVGAQDIQTALLRNYQRALAELQELAFRMRMKEREIEAIREQQLWEAVARILAGLKKDKSPESPDIIEVD